MQQRREKNKYIIYNEDSKILVFIKTINNTTKIALPSLSYFDITSEHFEIMEKLLSKKEDMIYLGKSISYPKTIFQSVNNKLQKTKLMIIRKYYSYYKEFTKEDLDMIMKLCDDYNMIPYFLTIEELKRLIENKYISLIDISIDDRIYNRLDELDKRLKFIKY